MLGELFRAVLAALLAAVTAVSATPMPEPDTARVRKGPVVGADISWPNCPKGLGIPSRKTLGKPLPRKAARFVVIGLTNGPAFHPNPCLASHVEYARERRMWASAYAVATYPTNKQLREYGDAGHRGPYNNLHRLLRQRNAASIKVVTLLDKPHRRTVNLTPDYCGFTVPDAFVVGYGLDYAEKYRNLPYIGILKEEVYR